MFVCVCVSVYVCVRMCARASVSECVCVRASVCVCASECSHRQAREGEGHRYDIHFKSSFPRLQFLMLLFLTRTFQKNTHRDITLKRVINIGLALRTEILC